MPPMHLLAPLLMLFIASSAHSFTLIKQDAVWCPVCGTPSRHRTWQRHTCLMPYPFYRSFLPRVCVRITSAQGHTVSRFHPGTFTMSCTTLLRYDRRIKLRLFLLTKILTHLLLQFNLSIYKL